MTDERERAIRDLTRHCGDGRLTLDELEERIEEVHRATTEAEIRLALRELPVIKRDAGASGPTVIPEIVLPPRLPHQHRHRNKSLEKTLKTAWTIAGFVALFNHMFWLAMILWFVLPKIVLPNLRRI